jgi:hypothetical protein
MQNIHGPQPRENRVELHRSTFQRALQAPRVAGIHGLQLRQAASSHCLLELASIHEVQWRVVRYPLPVALQEQQYAFMAAEVGCTMGMHNRSLLHICLRCHYRH